MDCVHRDFIDLIRFFSHLLLLGTPGLSKYCTEQHNVKKNNKI